ncbi:MAG TPA: hypothetical protein ENK68_00285 [Epsilonproteobacteria bacterium]|nr:hypothetical protein [Campylobacterota bacterium]
MKTNTTLHILFLLVFSSSFIKADGCADLKLDSEIVFGYFNGVQTTPKEAADALDKIETKFLNTYISTKSEKIEYTLFYNKTEGLADFAETFEQRTKEHSEILADKLENFWRIKNEDTATLEKIKKVIPAMVDVKIAEHQAMSSQVVDSLTNLISKSKTTNIMYDTHKEKLDCIETANKKLLIFAHSQGNRFSTQAYDYLTQAKMVPAKAVKVIHVAPASATLRGVHFLEDLDLVINGLRVSGTVPPVTHYMSNYLLRPVGINSQKDFLGHGLLEIYLNPHIDVSVDIYKEVESVFDSLEFPYAVDNNTSTGIDPDTFDYEAECTEVQFPQNVEDYDGVIKAVVNLYSHEPKEEICNKIKEELSGLEVETGGGTNPSEGFDYQTECSSVDFPDPIPAELESSINDVISNAGSTLAAPIVCPLIDTVVQAYSLTNGGGIPSPF